ESRAELLDPRQVGGLLGAVQVEVVVGPDPQGQNPERTVPAGRELVATSRENIVMGEIHLDRGVGERLQEVLHAQFRGGAPVHATVKPQGDRIRQDLSMVLHPCSIESWPYSDMIEPGRLAPNQLNLG